ncbi:MAG: putative lipid II flippase FtsW [Chloroflexota bacterium]
MNLNPPIPRLERLRRQGPARPRSAPDRDRRSDDDGRPLDRSTANRTPVKSQSGALRRESHQADYVILVVVVALSAIGILMVYSSSALKGYLSQNADTFATVGPQIQWAILGFIAMAAMMRVDYRYLRLASVPMYIVAIALLVLVFVPALNIEVGGSARWLKLPALPAIHPAEFAKLALVVYLAHWFAKRGKDIRGFWGGTVPFLVIVLPVIALVFKEPDLGTTMVITLTAFTMFFVAGANLIHLAVMVSGAAMAMLTVGLRGYQLDRIRVWQDPWLDRLGDGFHTVQGLLALGAGGLFGTGLGESKVFVPNAFNDFIFAEVGQEFGMIGAIVVITLFLLLAYSGVRVALTAPDTFGALLAAGITAWICLQAFINIGVVVALLPITGITLPFISAGGSSLIISFAAVGILLSISRETVDKGTWNDDATSDRGRRDGRAYLPGARRSVFTSRGS